MRQKQLRCGQMCALGGWGVGGGRERGEMSWYTNCYNFVPRCKGHCGIIVANV